MPGIQFYRPARSYPPVMVAKDVVIKAPPVLQESPKGPTAWLQYLIPLIGGSASLVFIFAFPNNPLFLIAGIGMAIASVGGGAMMAITGRISEKQKRKEQGRYYHRYLEQHEARLRALGHQQRMTSLRRYPSYEELVRWVQQQSYLWERRPSDDDFLSVRVGTGPAPLCCEIKLEQNRDVMSELIPELRTYAEAVVNKWSTLHDIPALIPLRSIGVLTIHGRSQDTRALARALLAQVVALQSPEDVRCMAYFSDDVAAEWSWLKWLPHVRRLRQIKAEKHNAPDHVCMLAHTAEDVSNLLFNQIKPELDRRRRLSEDRQRDKKVPITLPHLVVIFDPFSPFGELGHIPELEPLLNDAAEFGATVICLVEDLSQEPAQVQARISLTAIGILNYQVLKQGGERSEGVTADGLDPRRCERIARSMAPLLLAEAGAQQDLSQDVRLLDLLDITDADTFELAKTWRARERFEILKVPLGVRGDGEPLMIDFKEAADKGMGPHGLCIGATGSGKSELLRTMIISLAISHSPDMVSFVLIDFKGGASFADFGALPHVAGIITNLAADLTLVDRVYFSILGEQLRRQRMLRDAGNLDNIKQYRAKRQTHPEMEPMPHLLLIADEFSELLSNRPEFLELFITIGRVGRSLGMHLLFATQRLEEGRLKGLEGHLRYRICLRTFSPEESRAVLGKPDAYYLPSAPGVGYFKVDTDTYHQFKTALISVPYVSGQEQDSVHSKMRMFTSDGKLVKYQPVGTESAQDTESAQGTILTAAPVRGEDKGTEINHSPISPVQGETMPHRRNTDRGEGSGQARSLQSLQPLSVPLSCPPSRLIRIPFPFALGADAAPVPEQEPASGATQGPEQGQAPEAAQSTGQEPVPSAPTAEEPSDLHTEMDVAIDRIARLAQLQACQPVHLVWLPPLPKQLPLATVLQKAEQQELDGRDWPKPPPFGTLYVPLGLLDMPQEQKQTPHILDFSGAGGHLAVVGAPQTGKSTFLRTLVTALMLTHSPHDVQIYAVDLGGGLLRVFEDAPHVGAVCSKGERDKIRRTVRQMRKVIEDREYLFREERIDNMSTFRTRREKGELADFPFGDVFFIIDNMAVFMQEFDVLEDDLTQLVGTGLTYGVHLVLAANRWMELRPKLRDNIGTRLEFRLNDPADSEFGRKAAGGLPLGIPGRGLTKESLHFQVALPVVDTCADEEQPSAQQSLEAFVARVREHWDGPAAPPVRLLPALVPWSAMPAPEQMDRQRGLPFGLEELRLEPIFLDLISQSPHFLILGDTECGKTTLLRALIRGIEQRYTKEEAGFAIVDYRKTLVDFAESKNLLTFAYNASAVATCVANFKVDLEKRQKTGSDVPLSRRLSPKAWSGRHFFLFVDDYDALASSSNSPLSGLMEYLTTGRDIGFHVIIARRVGGMARSSFEPVLQRMREMGTSAIIMSGDKDEGRLLYNQAATILPPGRGYYVRRTHPPTLVQVAFAEAVYALD